MPKTHFPLEAYVGFQNKLGPHMPLRKTERFKLKAQVQKAILAKKRARKLKDAVTASSIIGGTKYRKAYKNYLLSYDARLAAIIAVNNSKRVSDRYSLNECFESAERHKNGFPAVNVAKVRRKPRSKPNTYRFIWDFQLRTAAHQKLLADCIKPLTESMQTDWLCSEQGVPKAIAKLVNLLENGCEWCAELDISEFYPSIRQKSLLPKLPLSKKVVEEVAYAANTQARSLDGAPLIGTCLSSARRGLPQGARSSTAIANWIMSQLQINLPDGVHLIVYADNLFLIASNRQKVEIEAKSLVEAVASLPGGPYKLKSPMFSSAADSIHLLGHTVVREGLSVRDYPNMANIQEYCTRIESGLVRATKLLKHADLSSCEKNRTLGVAELSGLRAYATSWRKSFRDCCFSGPIDLSDPANEIEFLLKLYGISEQEIKQCHNGKVRLSSHPSRSGS